jgi:chromosome segregation ATPase
MAVVAPRLLVHIASIAALAAVANSCVPVTRYEEVESASQVELASRRRAEATLAELKAKLEAAEAELAARDQKIADSERNLTETKLEGTLVAKERDEQNVIVDQLRGELARAGEHLRYYSDQKSELEQALGNAEKRSQELTRHTEKTTLLVKVMRDLSLELNAKVGSGKISLDAREGKLALGLAENGEDDRAVVDAVIKIMQAYANLKLELDESVGDNSSRAQKLKATLVERGVAEDRFQKPAQPANEAGGAPDGKRALELCFTAAD